MQLKQPETREEFEQYYNLRWRILRKPWGELAGSERDQEEDEAYHIMAVENDRVVGVARLQFPARDSAQLRYMAVAAECQGKGTGRKIIEHMEHYAQQQSVSKLFLHARENAVGFYLAQGYGILESSYLLFNTIQHYKMIKFF